MPDCVAHCQSCQFFSLDRQTGGCPTCAVSHTQDTDGEEHCVLDVHCVATPFLYAVGAIAADARDNITEYVPFTYTISADHPEAKTGEMVPSSSILRAHGSVSEGLYTPKN